MEKLLSLRKASRQRGFTLIETIVAIGVLTIGLMSVAALMSQMVTTSSTSRYMSTAALLASEKLEDLNHYSSSAPPANLAVGGGLGANVAGYFDTVQISQSNGLISEVTSENGVATVITHKPDGTVTVVPGAAAPANPGAEVYTRRWLIQASPAPPVALPAGVNPMRQITVLVTLPSGIAGVSGSKPLTFQMSAVRP
jgi:prepilin-type N-terminal cleavage/methylation domain-containing protein